MSNSAADPVMTAAARLEAAVERLAMALARPRAAGSMSGELMTDMVPRAEVAALTERLEATITRLKAALRDQEAPEDEGEE